MELFGYELARSGIAYAQELDWVFAAWRDHSSADEFARKPGWYQSMIVAAYRTERQIEAVLAEQRDIDFKKDQARREAENMLKGNYR